MCALHYKRQKRGRPLDWKPRGDLYRHASNLHKAAAHRAARAGLEITISRDWLWQKLLVGKCEVTGLPLKIGAGPISPLSASLDRVDRFRGYTPENTQVVCWMYNAAKGKFSKGEVLDFITQAARHLCAN